MSCYAWSRFPFGLPSQEGFGWHLQRQTAAGDVDFNGISGLDESDGTTCGCLGGNVTDGAASGGA